MDLKVSEKAEMLWEKVPKMLGEEEEDLEDLIGKLRLQ